MNNNVGLEVKDELIKYLFETTKTIDLLDEFEGYLPQKPEKYKRIVIRNYMYPDFYNDKWMGFNLVIERSSVQKYVGGITFTELKKGSIRKNGPAMDLYRFVLNEVKGEKIERYLNKDQFYHFSTPYLLRAQNSYNRTGYGWEWNWSGGIGTYTKGTLYGETTRYFITGVYVTSGYEYNPKRRDSFME